MKHTIASVGDKTSHGGQIITGSPTRKVQGKPVARLGDMCTCPSHGRTRIITVLPIMPLTDGLHTAHSGAKTACGASIIMAAHKDNQGPS